MYPNINQFTFNSLLIKINSLQNQLTLLNVNYTCDLPLKCFFRHLIKKYDTSTILGAKIEVMTKSAKNTII